LRQAYDYWQDQPDSYVERRSDGRSDRPVRQWARGKTRAPSERTGTWNTPTHLRVAVPAPLLFFVCGRDEPFRSLGARRLSRRSPRRGERGDPRSVRSFCHRATGLFAKAGRAWKSKVSLPSSTSQAFARSGAVFELGQAGPCHCLPAPRVPSPRRTTTDYEERALPPT